jgi:hypothetical protein
MSASGETPPAAAAGARAAPGLANDDDADDADNADELPLPTFGLLLFRPRLSPSVAPPWPLPVRAGARPSVCQSKSRGGSAPLPLATAAAGGGGDDDDNPPR